jgi:TolB protein
MEKLMLTLLAATFTVAVLHSQDRYPVKQLTFDSAQEGFPSWSPDGKTIVYMFIDMIDGKPVFGSRKISSDGGTPVQFTDFATEHPQWSPDGRLIVFDADTGASMKLIDAKGGSPKGFTADSIRIHKGGMPCWSPTGSHIAFMDSGGSLWVCGLKTGIVAKVFHQEGFVPLPGCWSRDGKGILIALMDRKTRLSTAWKVSADGKEKQQITGHRDSLYRYLALSPDGSLLVYAAMQGRRLGLWIMPAEGGRSLPLAVSGQYHNECPSWSPDGKRIAFASGRTGRGDIYLMELNVEKIKKELHSLGQ